MAALCIACDFEFNTLLRHDSETVTKDGTMTTIMTMTHDASTMIKDGDDDDDHDDIIDDDEGRHDDDNEDEEG